jgi:ferredoxin
MTKATPRILVCDCESSNPIDAKTIGRALDCQLAEPGSQLCRAQLGRFEAALDTGAPLVVACTQEAPLFLETAEAKGFAGDLRFVNIREKAGWSREGEGAAAKMAALIAEAMLEPAAPLTVTLESAGAVLLLGLDEVALEAAARLAERLDVTLLLLGDGQPPPPRLTTFPILRGETVTASGHLGTFAVEIGGLAPAEPSSRDRLSFAPPSLETERTDFDLILDLRGATPLFPAPEKRDGYFSPDPRDPAAVARACFDLLDLVGRFEKPRYVAYDPTICVHSRSGIVGCTRCLDHCPTGAIQPAGDEVAFDPFVCAGCGTCAAVCPSGAAAYTMPPADMLLTRLRRLLEVYGKAGGRAPLLLIHDGEHGEEMIDAVARHDRGLPANLIPFAVNAVTQCGLETLTAALAYGVARVFVLLPPRAEAEQAALQETLALANHILAGLGYGTARCSAIDEIDPERVAERLWSAAQTRGESVKPAAFQPSGNKRALLSLALAALHEAAPAPVDLLALPAGAPFGTVEVDVENCTLCLSCVGACPANALQDTPDTPRLSFLETACVQCGLCARTCPEKVITLTPRLDFTAAARNPRVIKEDEPFACVRCGEPFGSRSTIEGVVERMAAHAMFADARALERLRMCADCRVIDLAEAGDDPFKGAPRPRPRTTEDYLREREEGKTDDDGESS